MENDLVTCIQFDQQNRFFFFISRAFCSYYLIMINNRVNKGNNINGEIEYFDKTMFCYEKTNKKNLSSKQ